jgi:GNAT superfamily N-acetyltransferase
MNVSVKEVVTREDMEAFVHLPHIIYENNPFWVPALTKDELHTLDPLLNPAFDNCRSKMWLAYREGKIVGRIAGIMNHKHHQKSRRTFARFGWIDFVDDLDVSGMLLSTVEAWALKHRMRAVYGPLGFTDFDPEGLLVEGYDKPGLKSTIYNYPYYIEHLLHHGYHKDLCWVEYEVDIPSSVPERILRLSNYVKERHELSVMQFESASELSDNIDEVFQLINKAYSNLQGFVQIGERDMNFYLDQIFSFIDPDFISVVTDKNERIVAIAISMPSLTNALKKCRGKLFPFGWFHVYRAFKRNSSADLYLMAIHPALKNKGVSAILVEDLMGKFNKRRITKAFTHPISEKNDGMIHFWKHFTSTEFRRRCCFVKELAGRLAHNLAKTNRKSSGVPVPKSQKAINL